MNRSREQPLTVMQILAAALPGGAETFFVRLVSALDRRDDIVTVPVVRAGGWAARRLAELGIEHHEAPFAPERVSETEAVIRALATQRSPHVVQGWMTLGAGAVPEPRRMNGRLEWARVGRIGGYYDLAKLHGKVDELIVNTEEIGEHCIRQGWADDRVTVLRNGAPEPAAGWRDRREAARAAMNIPAAGRCVLLAARHHPSKGIGVALQALATLPEGVVLVLAGDGRERSSLESLAGALKIGNRVIFCGWLDEITDAAAAADLWIAPSLSEPFGNVVLDAWSHEIPIVTSDAAGFRDQIEDGENGLVVPAEDPHALAGAMARVLGDPELGGRLVTGGRATFEARNSEQMTVDAVVDYYGRLAAAR